MAKKEKTNTASFYFTTPEGEFLPPFVTCIGKKTRMKGELKFSQALAFCGTYEGTMSSSGLLYIAPEAKIFGNIKAKTIIVGGMVEGDIEASKEVELLSSCVVRGNIRSAQFRVADGCIFEGRCEMLKVSSNIDIFSASPEQLLAQLKNDQE